jgi:PQQ-like domain/IPT/TIG domain
MSLRRVICRFACIVPILFASAVAALAAPALTLSPAAGPPTTSITIAGTGFGATEAVDVYFDTTDLCLVATDGTGAFSCTLKAPANAQPQNHWITAVGRRDGLAAAKAFTVRTDWAQFHGLNSKHTGFNPYENTLSTSNVRNLDTLWDTPVGSFPYGAPTVVGGRVYIANGNKLYSFYNKTGAAFAGWPVTLGGSVVYGAPAVNGNIVYVGASDGKLYAFNAVTAAAIPGFPVTTGAGVTTAPTVAAGNVYVACSDGKLYGFNAITGVPVSGYPITVTLAGALYSTPTVAHRRVFIGTPDGYIYSFNATAGGGGYQWYNVAGGAIYSTPAVVSGQVFFGATDNKVYGVRANSG